MELIKGEIYLCSDQNIRRLDKIEPNYLYYSVPIGHKGENVVWMKLSRTYRNQVEQEFKNGKIIKESEIVSE